MSWSPFDSAQDMLGGSSLPTFATRMTEVKPEETRPDGCHQGACFKHGNKAGRGDGVASEESHREFAGARPERGASGHRGAPGWGDEFLMMDCVGGSPDGGEHDEADEGETYDVGTRDVGHDQEADDHTERTDGGDVDDAHCLQRNGVSRAVTTERQ